MDNYEMTGEEAARKYSHQFLHELSKFGLICDEVNASVIEETENTVTLKVNFESDSVMDRGNVEPCEFTAIFDKPLMSEDYMVPRKEED